MDSEPTFPPLLSGRAVAAGEDAFAAALGACTGGDAGAGDVFWSRSQGVMDVAVVLEPEVSATRSLQMLFVAMVAFGDSFGAIGPPEVGVFYRWPNQMLINDARFGEARVGLPDVPGDTVPDWLVVGLTVQIHPDESGPEPGHDLLNTSLWYEGAGEIDRTMLVESYSRHLLTWINKWGDDGFKPVHENWLGRAIGHDDVIDIDWNGKRHKGKFLSIDEEGNLLLKKKKDTASLPVADIVVRAGA
ncbi:MAG: hypothetical protein HKN11_10170 [Rhizobiales bacterium]|nr:hypothetical protein [Hyphomicrobiales bacterium]